MTSANIATKPGREDHLNQMLINVIGQFDVINIYANGYTGVPKHLRKEGINVVCGTDIADNGKFFFLKYHRKGDTYFTLDDDIIYPRNYRAVTMANLQIHPGSVACYHGRILSGVGLPYYTGHKRSHNFTGCTVQDERIDVAGTGCMAFEITEDFHPVHLYRSHHRKMSDLIFSLECSHKDKKIICCKHDYGWMKAINTTDGIFAEFKGEETPVQNELADQIYKLNYED